MVMSTKSNWRKLSIIKTRKWQIRYNVRNLLNNKYLSFYSRYLNFVYCKAGCEVSAVYGEQLEK